MIAAAPRDLLSSAAPAARRRTLVIGVLGCGTVGGGVVARLLADGALLGTPVRIGAILVRDLDKPRFPETARPYLTCEGSAIVDDPDIDIVVETIGGVEAARELVERALERGKHVVTANKSLVAACGGRLAALANEHHAAFRYEAAVGGAIPVVRAVGEFLAAEPIAEIAGVLNGTSNFILEGMRAGSSFADVLQRAQEAGFAEPDPTNDVEGIDAAQKLAVLIGLGLRRFVSAERIAKTGLRGLDPADFVLAQEAGLSLVPLALARPASGGIAALVSPAYVAADHDFARAQGPGNVIRIEGRHSGPLVFAGRGAGREATASAVLGDLADIARRLSRWEHQRAEALDHEPCRPGLPGLAHLVRLESADAESVSATLRARGVAARPLAPGGVRVDGLGADEAARAVTRAGASAASVYPVYEVA